MSRTKQRKIWMIGEKETYKYLGILEVDAIKQVEMKNFFKGLSYEDEKTTRNQAIWQKFHQRNKHQGCSPCKILRIIS